MPIPIEFTFLSQSRFLPSPIEFCPKTLICFERCGWVCRPPGKSSACVEVVWKDARPALKMNDFDVAPLVAKVFGDKATMTMFRLIFTT